MPLSFLEWAGKGYYAVNPTVWDLWIDALNFIQRYDPLALDLDGDGVETISANTGITFDFDGDGLKTGTGWVSGQDGFLVLDRNASGNIENGGELFGVDTVKANGEKATDGFDALRDLDSNSDGIFNSQDLLFSDVRVWQDVNQDGVSQAHELKTLAEHDIIAINLDSTSVSENSNGNLISAVGTFVRADGSESAVNGNLSQAANLDLASNPFYREFTDNITLDAAAVSLPDMRGSGAVRDLRQASMLNPDLKGVLAQYANAETRGDQLELLDNVLAEWAESSGYNTFEQRISAMSTDSVRFIFSYSWEKPQDSVGAGSGGSAGGAAGEEQGSGPTAAQMEQMQLLEKIRVLEVFNSRDFFNFNATPRTDANGNISVDAVFGAGSMRGGVGNYGGGVEGGSALHYITEADFSFNATQKRLINDAYDSLLDSVYQGLLFQTRLKPYVDEIDLNLSAGSVELDFSGVTQMLDQKHAGDPVNASVDLFELLRVVKGPVEQWSATLGSWVSQLDTAQQQAFKVQLGALSTIEFGNITADSLTLGVGDDFLFAGEGNDRIRGNEGNDFLDGGSGDDYLYGDSGSDILRGGAGVDRLYGGTGDDILDGGTGSDLLNGGAGSDTYLFGVGAGNDIINNYDRSAGRFDVVLLEAGLSKADLQLARSGYDLMIKLKDHEDTLRVDHFFFQDAAGGYQIDQIQFADGQSWSVSEIKQIVLQPAEGLTQIQGYESDDVITGSGANEYIYGNGGNDTLTGGGGNDRLEGGLGNDVLDGGAGNDNLSGGFGSDTYMFGFGSGHDVVNNYDNSSGRFDRILVAAGVTAQDVLVQRSNSDLVLSLGNGEDSIRVQTFFRDDGTGGYQIDRIDFADGTQWNVETIKQLALEGTSGTDRLTGYATGDVINGGAGDDFINGAAGNDTLLGGFGNDTLQGADGDDALRGGSGNDYLTGGEGSDTYLFGRGDGHDRIDTFDRTLGRVDVLQLDEGIVQSDIRLTRSSNNNLVVTIKDTGDTVTVIGFFYDDADTARALDRIAFADGSFWDIEQLKLKVFEPSDEADILYGYATDDVITGGGGNDQLLGNQGDDYLSGGAGNDRLDGGVGDDILDGGAGDDYLSGGEGSDTYVFGHGSGRDVINNFDRSSGSEDLIQIASDISPVDIQLRREGNHLALRINGSEDVLTVQHYFESDATDGYQVDRIVFADGTSWNVDAVKQLVQEGTDGTDILYGYAADDVMQGLAGDDDLYGYGGDDHLSGGDGNDRLYGGDGNDTLLGGEGNDFLSGDAGHNLLDGQGGNDTYWGAGNDTLRGNAGNDYLIGGSGSDTYKFAVGDGQDVINNLSATAGVDTDVLSIEGIVREDLWLSRDGDNLVLDVLGTDDRMTIQDWYASADQTLDAVKAGSSSLYANQVDTLVNAMAAFGVPVSGQLDLTQAQRDQVDVVIAASWQ